MILLKWLLSVLQKQSPGGVSYNKGVLKNLGKFTGNTCARVSLLIKLQATALRRLRHKVFPVNFAKFLRTLFFIEYLRLSMVCGLVLQQYISERKFRRYVSNYTNSEGTITFNDLIIYTVCSINRIFYIFLENIRGKDSWKIYVQHIQQW